MKKTFLLILFLFPSICLADKTVQVRQGYSASATILATVFSQGSILPAPNFMAEWYDSLYSSNPESDPNYERVWVVYKNGDVLHGNRGYDGTSAKSHNTTGHTYMLNVRSAWLLTETPTPTWTQTATLTSTNTSTHTPSSPTPTFTDTPEFTATPTHTPLVVWVLTPWYPTPQFTQPPGYPDIQPVQYAPTGTITPFPVHEINPATPVPQNTFPPMPTVQTVEARYTMTPVWTPVPQLTAAFPYPTIQYVAAQFTPTANWTPVPQNTQIPIPTIQLVSAQFSPTAQWTPYPWPTPDTTKVSGSVEMVSLNSKAVTLNTGAVAGTVSLSAGTTVNIGNTGTVALSAGQTINIGNTGTVAVNNPPTPDTTKVAQASIQLTHTTQLNLQLTPAVAIATAVAASVTFQAAASGTQAASVTFGDFTKPNNCRLAMFVLDVTVVTGAGIFTLSIDNKDPVSGKYILVGTSANVSTVSTNVYKVGVGLTAAANLTFNDMLTNQYRIRMTKISGTSQAFSIGVNYTN